MSETNPFQGLALMGLDTIRLKTPYLPKSTVDQVKAKGESWFKFHNETGEKMWEMTRANLRGSFDSRIMVKPMYEDSVKTRNGKPEMHPSLPYLIVECSVGKAFNGQNIYGVIDDLQDASERLRTLMERLLGLSLPNTSTWRVQRLDWAENFTLPREAVPEFFEAISNATFPRRKVTKYANESIFAPGATTTLKLYHKGPEFERNDSKRLYHVLRNLFHQDRPKDSAPDWAHRRASRKVSALRRLAHGRLRAEVEIHAEKMDYDFGRQPMVREITTEYMQAVFDKEMSRLLREGQDAIQIVRTSLAVRDRLEAHYSPELAGRLYGLWHGLATHGEDDMKNRGTRPTFYRLRKQLIDVGVSWLATDVQLIERQGQKLPADFSPVRANPRRCTSLVRERPAFNIERGLLQLAA